jgi:hypothetical protein
MGRIARVAALCAALAAPAAAWSQPAEGLRTPGSGMGSSQGVASGWQYQRRGRRTVQASGVAVAGLLLLAAATASSRR